MNASLAFSSIPTRAGQALKNLPSLVAGLALMIAPSLHAAEDLDLFGGSGFAVEIAYNDTSPRTLDGTDFGSTNVTGGSVTNSFLIRNNGNENLVIVSSSSTNSQFTVAGLPLPTSPIAPGGTDVFTVTFNPSDQGQWNSTIGIISGAPSENPFFFRVTGQGIGFPEIVVEGRSATPGASFGNVSDGSTTPQPSNGTLFLATDVGDTSTQNFRISNTGDGTLTVSIIDNSGHFSQTGWATSVAPGGTDNFSINFTPTSYGVKTATVTITNNDSNENPFTFDLLGTGVAPDILVQGGPSQNVTIADGDTSPRTTDGTDFGSVNLTGGSKTNTFVIRNEAAANENLVVTSATLSGSGSSHFSVMAAPSPASPISPGNSASLLINFNPSSAGTKTATVTILSNDPDETPYTFAITGVSLVQPEINVQGARNGLPYVNITDGSTTTAGTNGTSYVDTNVGSNPVNLFKIQNTGDDKLTYSASSSNPEFSILGIGEAIGAGETDDFFQISFAPTSTGTRTTTITIDNNDANENPYTFVLQGTGEAPDISVLGGSGFTFTIPDGDTTPNTTDGTNFGSQHIIGESQISSFGIRNSGNTPLTVTSVTLTGSDTSHFTVTGAPGSGTPISAGATFPFSITFNPFSTGVKNATVTLLSTDPDESPYTFLITGTGVNGPNIDVKGSQDAASLPYVAITNGSSTPLATNGTVFEDTDVGSSETNYLRIFNAGNLDLSYRITSSSPEFIVTQVDSPLAPTEINTVFITFTPTSGGTKTALITIDSNDADESPYTFTLSGLARSPEIDVRGGSAIPPIQIILDGDTTPTATDGTLFGSVNVSGGFEQHQFRIINQGNSSLTILSGGLSDGTHFQIVGLPSAPSNEIPPGASITFAINFDPQWDGELTDTVTLVNTDTNEGLFNFDIKGTGLGNPEIGLAGTADSRLGYFNIPDGSTNFSIKNGTLFTAEVEVGRTKTNYFRIDNYGDGLLNITSINANGGNGNFRIVNVDESPPFDILPGEDHRFWLVFEPIERGVKTTEFTIHSNDSDEDPYTFQVQATAIGRDVEVLGGVLLDQSIANGDNTTSVIDGTDYGDVPFGGSALVRTFKLRNEGELPLQYITASVSNTTDFAINELPAPAATLAGDPTGFKDFTITFDPTSVGVKSSVVTILTDDPDEAPFTFTVSGNGVTTVPDADLEVRGGAGFTEVINAGDFNPTITDNTDFGTALEGSAPVTQEFQLKNIGGTNLLGIQTSSGNPDVTVSSTATSLTPGSTATLTVTFDPQTPGTQTAVVGIASTDPNESPYLFTVKLEVEPATSTPPTIESFVITGTSGSAGIMGTPGQTYRLTTSTTLDNDWILVPGTSPVVATGSLQTIDFTINPTTDPKRFYRLEEVP